MAADLRNIVRPDRSAVGELLDGVSTCVVWLDAGGFVLHLNEPACQVK